MVAKHPKFTLKLFISGQTVSSLRAVDNLRRICEEKLAGHYEIEIIDVQQKPELAEANYIVATPTLVKELPRPMRQFLGDLSDVENVLLGLNIYSS